MGFKSNGWGAQLSIVDAAAPAVLCAAELAVQMLVGPVGWAVNTDPIDFVVG